MQANRFALPALGRAWILFGSRKNSKPEKFLKTAPSPTRRAHPLLGSLRCTRSLLAGRRQFVRWALTPGRIVECPGFPGDSSGFNAIEEHIQADVIRVDMEDGAFVQSVPLKRLIDATVELLKKSPLALFCQRTDCERCNAVRNM